MSEGVEPRPAGIIPPAGVSTTTPPIQVVKLRHPWRIVAAVVLVVLVVLFVVDAAQRSAYGWGFVGKYVFDRRISAAALVTLQLTVYSMVIGVVLGLLLAVMRLS